MTTPRPLGLRVRPRFGETAPSLVTRLSWRHGMADATTFSSWIGTPLAELAAGRRVEELASLTGVDHAELALSTARHDPLRRHVLLRAERLRRLDWSAATRRWCPSCFADDIEEARREGLGDADLVSHRAWWDLLPLATCPVHAVALSERCVSCDTAPTWGAAPLNRCACGASLAHRWEGSARVGACDRFIHDRMTGRSGHPALLRASPLSSALPILRWLGLADTGKWDRRWPQVGSRMPASRDLFEAGMRIASNWPDAFVDVLNRGFEPNVGKGTGMLAAYGWVHEQFASRLEASEAGQAIRTVLREHAVANGVVAIHEAVLGFPANGGTVGLTEACSLLGSGFARARRTLTAQRQVPRGSRPGVRHTIDRHALLTLAARRNGRLDMGGVGSMLSLGRGTVRMVVASGLLDAADRTQAGDLARSFDETAVRRLVVGLASRVDAAGEGDDVVDLAGASRCSGSNVAAILQRVGSGVLTPVRWSTDGSLRDVRFRRSDFSRPPRTVDGHDLSEVARRTGIHPEAVRALAVSGLLKGHRAASAWSFAEADIEAFQRTYMSGAEVAAELATSPRSAIARLLGAGVLPVAEPPACRQTIFRRREVASAGRSLARRAQAKGPGAASGTRRRIRAGSA